MSIAYQRELLESETNLYCKLDYDSEVYQYARVNGKFYNKLPHLGKTTWSFINVGPRYAILGPGQFEFSPLTTEQLAEIIADTLVH